MRSGQGCTVQAIHTHIVRSSSMPRRYYDRRGYPRGATCRRPTAWVGPPTREVCMPDENARRILLPDDIPVTSLDAYIERGGGEALRRADETGSDLIVE